MSRLKIAAIQMNIRWLDKESNLQELDRLLELLGAPDLILLPETFSTGFAIDCDACKEPAGGGRVLEWMKRKAHNKSSVIAGSVLVECQGKKVNRFYWVYPEGKVCYYDKRHLFRMGNEQEHVIAGTRREIVDVCGIKILPIVCYDLRFPVWSRNNNDYDLMINVANWPAIRRNVWDILLKARAIENQCFVVGVNRIGEDGKGVEHSGGTAVYNYLGETLVSASDDTEEIVEFEIDFAELENFKAKFPAYLDADEFNIIK
ncbi:amidohydrolase [Aliikangiella sp. G2MR2-5]|uniref:amidohydrolase n=1 Tax=Aliikangiella sp. G2MR2-5 TaxID=2788943 RepID=UPI0018AB0099|nr:amidohydrolase [Aliikangiella sp. G2MR2-5]